MSYGLQVFDSVGTVFLDTSNRISRLIGTYTVNLPAGTVANINGYSQWPYTWTNVGTILSTSYSELNGMTAASNQWAVISLTPSFFAKIVDLSGVGRIIVYANSNLDPRLAKTGSVAVFRF